MSMQAVAMHLRGSLQASITRSGDYIMSLKIYEIGSSQVPLYRAQINSRHITSETELEREINTLWRDLHAKGYLIAD